MKKKELKATGLFRREKSPQPPSISAKELQRQLQTSYKAAWYMAHRVRLAMQQDEDFCLKFSGVCEADETYVGGKRKGQRGRSAATKVPAPGLKEKTSGKVRMVAASDVSANTLKNFIRLHVEAGSEIHSDVFSFRLNNRREYDLMDKVLSSAF